MRKHYELILKDAERRALKALRFQVNEAGSVKDGGFKDDKEIIQPKFSIYRVVNIAAVYMNRDSSLYNNEELKNAILKGLDYIRREQRENGTFDLVDCNFYSGPDTAFCVKRILPFYKFVLANPSAPSADIFEKKLREIIYNAAKGMTVCGFHTPNHRWAIASNLLECWKLFGDDCFKKRAEEYLIEGIDCTEDGEYAERSAGNYNRINNDAMITVGEILGDDMYFDCARRNLNMMLTYFEPDDSIFTNNSTRQDRGVKVFPKDYYFEYLYMGARFNDETFLATANYIMETNVRRNRLPEFLINYMIHPELIDVECSKCGYSTVYDKFYEGSGIVRRRNDEWSYTIINKASNFVWFQRGDLCMSLKIGASFGYNRTFTSENITKENDTYHLTQTMHGWYYLPFGEYRGTSDFWAMDNEHTRDRVVATDMNFDVKVKEIADGLEVKIKAFGTDRAPFRLEVAFDAGAQILTEQTECEGLAGEYMICKSGMVTATRGDHAIEVGPGFYDHRFVAGKFGSEGRNPNCFTVYFTDTTEFEHTVYIKAKDGLFYETH